MDAPLLIAGCPRSGTSLTSHAFAACGMWRGHCNSLGENVALKQQVLKPQLRAGGMDPIAVSSFADVEADPQQLRRQVEGVLDRQGYQGGPWLFKDVKLVFVWQSWDQAFPGAQWVTVWREPEAILASFDRWGLATSRPGFDGRRIIREHHDRARQIPGIHVYPDDLFCGDHSQYRQVCEDIGVEWDLAAVRKAVDPDRYHVGVPK